MHFSPEIFSFLLRAQDMLSAQKPQVFTEDGPYVTEIKAHDSHSFQFSVSVQLDNWKCNVELEDDAENSAIISLTSGGVDFRYSLEEAMKFWFLTKMLTIGSFCLKDGSSCSILCSTRNEIGGTINVNVAHSGLSLPELSNECSGQGCVELHYQAQAGGHLMQQECCLCLCDVDLHIYPRIFGLLQKFFSKLKMQSSSISTSVKSFRLSENNMDMEMADDELCKFGFSNFYNIRQTTSAKISLDHFPFVSIVNSGWLNSLEGSMILGIPELRNLCCKDKESTKSLNLNFRRRPRLLKGSIMSLPSSSSTAEPSMNSDNNCFSMEFSLNRVRAHFHDSSCILGTLVVPISISCLRSYQTDCWDILSSVQGLALSSSWSSPNIHELLLGPSSPSNLPVVNIRLRKGKMKTVLPITEISIGIQHVGCILSSEFLSLFVGYFSLPDWTLEHVSNVEFENSQNTQNDLLCKFEALDSTVLLPLENHEYCIQLEFPQLTSSFIPMSSSAYAFREIPFECMISGCTGSERVDIFNLFGRSASVSLLLLGDGKNLMLKPDELMSNTSIPLIAQLDADLWIRTPCNTKDVSQQSVMPVLIMMSVSTCNFIARDDFFISGLEAVIDVADQLSSVAEKSVMYKSDVLQFLQRNRNMEEDAVSFDISSQPTISIRCYVRVLSLMFCRFRVEDPGPGMVAKAEMQLNLSAIMRNGLLESLDANIPCLVVRSSTNSILLVSFTPEAASSSHLCFNLSRSCSVEYELLVTISFLAVWLHLFDWNDIVDLLKSYTTHLVFASEYVVQENVSWKIKSENITVCVRIPSASDGELIDSEIIEVDKLNSQEVTCHNLAESMQPFKSKNCKYVKLTVHSKSCEMIIGESCLELKCNLEKMRVMLEMVHNYEITSIPFMHVYGLVTNRRDRLLLYHIGQYLSMKSKHLLGLLEAGRGVRLW